jgi:hypothetical protein
MNTIVLLAILFALILLLGEVIHRLGRIEEEVRQTRDIRVSSVLSNQELVAPGRKLGVQCVCNHERTNHKARQDGFMECLVPGCSCAVYRPKKGSWPTDPGKM